MEQCDQKDLSVCSGFFIIIPFSDRCFVEVGRYLPLQVANEESFRQKKIIKF